MFALPAVAVVDGAHALGVGPGTRALIRRDAMGPLQLVSAGVTTAAVVAVIGLLAFECLNEELRRPRRTAVAVAVVFALGTQAWSTASRALWQHGPSLLFLSLAVLMAVRLERPEQGATASRTPSPVRRRARGGCRCRRSSDSRTCAPRAETAS